MTEKMLLRSVSSNLETSRMHMLLSLSMHTLSLPVREAKETSNISAILRVILIEEKPDYACIY